MKSIEICMYCGIIICIEILISFVACAVRELNEFRKELAEGPNLFEEDSELIYCYDTATGRYFIADTSELKRMSDCVPAALIFKTSYIDYRTKVINDLAE